MGFILVPKQGKDLYINGWNWRATIALLYAEKVIDGETHERMGAQGCGGAADAALACRIADALDSQLEKMKPGDRMRQDLTVTDEPKRNVLVTEADPTDIDSASYDWLVKFRDFCKTCEGFKVC
jgi:hypothetical protein